MIYVDSGGTLRESLGWHNAYIQNTAAGPYNDGKPHQVVATYGAGTDKLYVDGQLKGSQSVSEFGYSTGYSYYVGTGYTQNWPNTNGGWQPFGGVLGQVSIYGTTLSSSRVQAHFGAGSAYPSAVQADGPAVWYRLDDNTGAAGPLGGFGLWPLRQTDPNGQITTIGYDGLGREVSRSLPGETGGGAPSVLSDQSGHGAQASWSGGVGFGTAGLISGDANQAMNFDGTSGFVQLPASAFGAYPTSGSTTNYTLTFEAWFQTTTAGVILGQTDGQQPSAAPGGYVPALYVDSAGTLHENLFWHGAVAGNMAAGPWNDGHSHQVVVTYSGGTESLYVDGQLKSSATSQSETGYASSYAYQLGAGYSGGQWPNLGAGWTFFHGTLDDVSVYGSALPAARVQAHFAAGAGYRSAVLADSPSTYLRLDDTGASQATLSTSYTVWCTGVAGGEAPCVEVDKTQRLNSTTTATSRAFYDGFGHLVETRSPAPGSKDVVQ